MDYAFRSILILIPGNTITGYMTTIHYCNLVLFNTKVSTIGLLLTNWASSCQFHLKFRITQSYNMQKIETLAQPRLLACGVGAP